MITEAACAHRDRAARLRYQAGYDEQRTVEEQPLWPHRADCSGLSCGRHGTGLPQRGDERVAPSRHGVLAQDAYHRRPPRTPLLERHAQASTHGFGHFVNIDRVDEQRRVQLVSRASEARQHEDAGVFRILSGNEFLGDEIHSVTQRRDQTDPCDPVKSRQGLPREAPIDVADGCPVELGEFAVDAAGGEFELATQSTILTDLAPRVRCNLEISKAAAVLGPIRQQAVDSLEAIGYALAVVKPIDADDQVAVREALAQTVGLGRDDGPFRQLAKMLRINADRKGGGTRSLAMGGEPTVAELASTGDLGDVVEKGADSVRRLKADEIIGA